jgi:ABC-type nitrate/sulfonate/bicarbonate transport system substrate-binding protein
MSKQTLDQRGRASVAATNKYRHSFGRAALLWFLAGSFLAPFCALSLARAQVKSFLASSVTSESMATVWVARDRGLFKKHGIDMDFVLMPRNSLTVAALIAGEIDAALIGPGHLINAGLSGADLIGIASFQRRLDFRLNVRPDIKKAEDLRSKKIAISGPGATSHIVSLLALKSLHIDPAQAKITFLTIPGTEMNRRLALETGAVDATTLHGSVGDLYGEKGYPILYNFKTTGATLPQNMLVTTRRTATSKPQLIEGYLEAMIEAIAFIGDPVNKELVTKLLATNLRLPNAAAAEESYNSVVDAFERVPRIDLDGMKQLQQIMAQINPKVAGVRVERVIDNSFVNRLQSSGYIQSMSKTH